MIRPTFTPSEPRGLVAPVPRGVDELRDFMRRMLAAGDPARALVLVDNMARAFEHAASAPGLEGEEREFTIYAAAYLDGLRDVLSARAFPPGATVH
jgi:hypothetical protein